jgi:xylulokinase
VSAECPLTDVDGLPVGLSLICQRGERRDAVVGRAFIISEVSVYLLGIDLGSSSVKASILDAVSGLRVAGANSPETEQEISAPQPGFAEQDPAMWCRNARLAVRGAIRTAGIAPDDVRAVGIAYQMHGLVCVDSSGEVLRPAIIWCDSRAVPYGEAAVAEIGEDRCLTHLLNSPGNFTASKLAWIKEHEPEIFGRIHRIMLPGDWLAFALTGRMCTTRSGLSEGVFWDFQEETPCAFVMDHFGFDPELLAEQVPTFGVQGELTAAAAAKFGLAAGTPVAYRAGDQPNNALSLNVLNPGEVAATAGTSGVVYGVSVEKRFDPQSRVNTFLHVNHTAAAPRLGVLLCINGAGSINAWTRRLLGDLDYGEMNRLAEQAPVGCDGLAVLPFGNGAERMLDNRVVGAQICGLDLNRHTRAHLCRAVQEGVVFSFHYGMKIMQSVGMTPSTIRAGFANMFQSDVFCDSLASVSGATIELYETDGALGAARGAGVGAGIYGSFEEAFAALKRRRVVEPKSGDYLAAYRGWEAHLKRSLG